MFSSSIPHSTVEKILTYMMEWFANSSPRIGSRTWAPLSSWQWMASAFACLRKSLFLPHICSIISPDTEFQVGGFVLFSPFLSTLKGSFHSLLACSLKEKVPPTLPSLLISRFSLLLWFSEFECDVLLECLDTCFFVFIIYLVWDSLKFLHLQFGVPVINLVSSQSLLHHISPPFSIIFFPLVLQIVSHSS